MSLLALGSLFSRPRLRLLLILALLIVNIAVVRPRRASTPAAPSAAPLGTSVFVDADPGVDDAVTLGILLRSRVPVVGITTVADNNTVDNATRNALTILDVILTTRERVGAPGWVDAVRGAYN